MTELEQLFVDGAKTIDSLDIYRSLNGKHIKYTSDLLKKSTESNSLDRTINNMKSELNKIKVDTDSMVNSLKEVYSELNQ